MPSSGIHLSGRWGVMVFNFQTWQRLLSLAYNYGWQAEGGSIEIYWLAGYRVSESDAVALAHALERSLPDIPDHQAVATASEGQPTSTELRRLSAGISLVEWFSGATKQNIVNFIHFCRAGGSFQVN